MERVGPFTILEHLGRGALGDLFRASDTRHGRGVALRVVASALADVPATRAALLADADATRAFAHPCAAGLLDIVEHEGRLLLVHDLAAGQPLSTLLAGGPLAPSRAVRIAAQAAEALGAAAAHGLRHGALTPRDILVGEGDRVSVLDIGLSRWTGSGKARLSAAAVLEGQVNEGDEGLLAAARYLPPEQVLGTPGDGRGDVFSLGVILHQMLTGDVPFAGDTAPATLLKILQAPATPPSHANQAIPVELDAVVQRALAKSLEVRYATAAEMAHDLRQLQALPGLGAVDETASPVATGAATSRAARRARKRRRRLAWAVVAVVLLTLAAAAGWYGRNALGLPWQDAKAAAPRPVVMVLPFVVGAGEARTYFGLGFAEDLAARVGEVPGASVVGRTTIRALDALAEWRIRAPKLGATVVLKGTVRPGDYAFHADVEAVDPATGTRLWSRHFERPPQQVSGIQADIAAQLAQHLGLPAPTGNRWARAAARQIDPAAYALYLQGRDAADRRDRGRAIGLYEQALQRDAKLVEARASLSQALYLEEYYGGGHSETAAAGRALREAEAALAVDAELPAAHVASALAAGTVTQAASALARALAFDPSNGEAWHYAGDLVSELDPARSVAFYRASLGLEPGIDANWRDIASVQATMGNAVEAAQSVTRGEAARQDRPWWTQMRARLEIDGHRHEQAVRLLSGAAVEATPVAWLMGRVVPLAMAGRMAEARSDAARLVERYPSFCEGRGVLAGLEVDGGTQAHGEALAGEIFQAAGRSTAEPSERICAALAAAALGDSAAAASWLSRTAGDDRALRLWTRQAIFSVGLSFRSRWYPWPKVMGSQPMQVATGQLEQNLGRLREEVRRRLPTPPAPPGAAAR